MNLWDVTLEHSLEGTRSILKLLCLTVFGDRNCPASNCLYNVIIPETSPLCKHFLQCHTDLPSEITPDDLTNCIITTVTAVKHFTSGFVNCKILTFLTVRPVLYMYIFVLLLLFRVMYSPFLRVYIKL